MPQKNIWEFYSICKKKLDKLHAKKLNRNRRRNVENRLSSFDSRREEGNEVNNNNNNNNNEPTRTTGTAKNFNLIKQSKLGIDNETRQIILKSNTIIDQAKSPANQNYCSSLKDEFIFKRPQSPAPKAKRKLSTSDYRSFSDSKTNSNRSPNELKRFRSSILFESQQTIQNYDLNQSINGRPIECKVRKRLFDSGLDDVKDRLQSNSTDEFINKLRDFQEKTSISNRFNVSFYSPSKRAKEQNETIVTAAKKDITNYSPQKYLENRLKHSSSSLKSISTNLFSATTENSPPKPSSSTYLSPQKSSSRPLNSSSSPNLNSPFKSPFKLPFRSPIKSNSPFKSPNKSPLSSPFKSPLKRPANELSLPDKYLELAREFGHLDAIVIYLSNQNKICTFDKVKLGVQKLIKREFDLQNLAQILTICPSVYSLNYELINEKYHLIIKPSIEANELTKAKIYERFSEFKQGLYRFAKKVHSEYLLTLERPIKLNDDQQLKRWHPSFRFPDIPEANLPTQPSTIYQLDDAAVCSPSKKIDEEIEVVFEEENPSPTKY